MSNLSQPKHIHRLKRHRYKNGETIFFCMMPRCKYRSEFHLALGEEVICNRCSKPFIMNERSIRLDRPHCEDCVNRKIGKHGMGLMNKGRRVTSLTHPVPSHVLEAEGEYQPKKKESDIDRLLKRLRGNEPDDSDDGVEML